MRYENHSNAATYNGPTFRGMHERVSDELGKSIHDVAEDCTAQHLRELGKQRYIRVAVDTEANTLSMVYGCPFSATIHLPIVEFCAPLSLVAAKFDGIREAFICAEVEKLIEIGERIIRQKFGVK